MARLKYLEKTDVARDLQSLYTDMEKAFGAVLNPAKLYAHFPAFFRGVLGLVGSLDEAAEIDAGLRSMVRVRVATINGCPF